MYPRNNVCKSNAATKNNSEKKLCNSHCMYLCDCEYEKWALKCCQVQNEVTISNESKKKVQEPHQHQSTRRPHTPLFSHRNSSKYSYVWMCGKCVEPISYKIHTNFGWTKARAFQAKFIYIPTDLRKFQNV